MSQGCDWLDSEKRVEDLKGCYKAIKNNFKNLQENISKNLIQFGLKIAEYFEKNKNDKEFLSYCILLHQKNKKFFDYVEQPVLEKLLELNNTTDSNVQQCEYFFEALDKHVKNQKKNGETLFDEANNLLCGNQIDITTFKKALVLLKSASIKENISAIEKLKTLAFSEKEKNSDRQIDLEKKIHASICLANLLNEKGSLKTKKESEKKPLFFHKDFSPTTLFSRARDAYEELLRKNTFKIALDVAMLQASGECPDVYPQNDFLARHYFEKAECAQDEFNCEASFSYAALCFHQRGGPLDIEKAEELVLGYLNDDTLSAEQYYFLGDLFYLKYQDKYNNDSLKDALKYFISAAEKGYEDAKYCLQMIFERDPNNKKLEDYLKQKSLTIQNENQKKDYPSFDFLKKEMEDKNDSRAMRKYAERYIQDIGSEDFKQAITALKGYYEKKEHGLLNLISSLCYEAKRHSCDNKEYKILHAVISELDENYSSYTEAEFKTYLYKKEKEEKSYFDEYPSDDSDAETETNYQASDNTVTAKEDDPQQFIKKLSVDKVLKCLKEMIEFNDEIEDSEYKKKVEHYAALFRGVIFNPSSSTTVEERVLEDLQTLNHYAAQNKLAEAFKLISTQFCVAQTRGIEFRTTGWGKNQRMTFREQARDKDHPHHNKILHSFSAFKHAGVNDFSDQNRYTQIKLDKATYLIRLRLSRLSKLPPHKKNDFPSSMSTVGEKMTSRTFNTRMQQVQQLYSLDRQLFLNYIQWESEQKEAVFVNGFNPFISTGDIISTHPGKYAYGNKAYKGFEDERLRPRYDQEGKPSRPYSGAIYVTIHPLYDYRADCSHHIPAMNTRGDITIMNNVLAEREQTFFSDINKDRLKFIHIAKFPSFSQNEEHVKTYLYRYGLTFELYKQFKSLMIGSSPHSSKRRLTKHLLGEYISAYQTLYLHDYACRFVKKKKPTATLLYRDRYGNFSLRPKYEIDANPNGGEEHSRLRRMHTREMRKEIDDKSEEAVLISNADHSSGADENSLHTSGSDNSESADNTTSPPNKKAKLDNSPSVKKVTMFSSKKIEKSKSAATHVSNDFSNGSSLNSSSSASSSST